MTKWRYGWLFPLVLAALLGGLSAWLERVSEIKIEAAELNPNEPQYAMYGISGKRFGEDGKTVEHLTADNAWQLPKSSEVVLEQPKLVLLDGQGANYSVRSSKAAYDTETRTVVFTDNVVLNRHARNGGAEGEVATQQITVDTRNERAYSDQTVRFRYGLSAGTAQGFTYDYQQGLLKLPSRVRATIYDSERHLH